MRMDGSFWRQAAALAVLVLVLGVAGCDSPSPAFSGLAARQVTVEGSTFSVRATRRDAEAIRINREWRPRRGAIVVKAAAAIEIASGCPVRKRSLSGDTNIVRARLDCPGTAPLPERERPPDLDCALVTDFSPDGFGGEVAQVECLPAR